MAQVRPQEIQSNEECVFFVDGKRAGAGRFISLQLAPGQHEIACEANGYKPKTTYASPPFGDVPIRFTFMVEDKVDAPLSWSEIQRIEDRQKLIDLRAASEKYALRVQELDYDPHSRKGKVTVAKVTLEDHGRIRSYIEEFCQSKNKLLVVGRADREGAAYLIEDEQAGAGAYSMWFRCVY